MRGDFSNMTHTTNTVLLLALVVGCTKVNLEPIDGAGGGGGQAQAQSNASTNNSTGSQGGAGQGGTSMGGASNINLYLDNIVQGANCQPEIPPDPLMLMFTFNVATTTWTPMITPVGARIDSGAGSTSFQTDMVAITPGPNVDIGIEVRKLPDTAMGTPACMHCGNQDAVLYVDVELDGVPETVSEPLANYNCVF